VLVWPPSEKDQEAGVAAERGAGEGDELVAAAVQSSTAQRNPSWLMPQSSVGHRGDSRRQVQTEWHQQCNHGYMNNCGRRNRRLITHIEHVHLPLWCQ
jgi:hypothetical protein